MQKIFAREHMTIHEKERFQTVLNALGSQLLQFKQKKKSMMTTLHRADRVLLLQKLRKLHILLQWVLNKANLGTNLFTRVVVDNHVILLNRGVLVRKRKVKRQILHTVSLEARINRMIRDFMAIRSNPDPFLSAVNQKQKITVLNVLGMIYREFHTMIYNIHEKPLSFQRQKKYTIAMKKHRTKRKFCKKNSIKTSTRAKRKMDEAETKKPFRKTGIKKKSTQQSLKKKEGIKRTLNIEEPAKREPSNDPSIEDFIDQL